MSSSHFFLMSQNCIPLTSLGSMIYNFVIFNIKSPLHGGSGCGTIDKAVDSDTKGPGFESNHRQLLLNNYLLFLEKTKIKKKIVGMDNLKMSFAYIFCFIWKSSSSYSCKVFFNLQRIIPFPTCPIGR